MWAEAARALAKYPEAVLTATDTDGYPFSVRVRTSAYEAATGELVATIPAPLQPVESSANLLCHYHDEKLWKLSFLHVEGRLESRDGRWVFTTTSFIPPAGGQLAFMRNLRRVGAKYLAARALSRSAVNWAAVKDIQRRAKAEST